MVTFTGLNELFCTDTLAGGGVVVAVAVKTTGEPVSPFTLAVSVWVPALGPSVRVTEATPLLPVTGDADDTDPPPLPTTQVTEIPVFPFPCASITITLCAVARVLFTEPVWLLPPFNTICVAFPAVAVALMLTGYPTSPVTVATVA